MKLKKVFPFNVLYHIVNNIITIYYKLFKSSQNFVFQGEDYQYFYHPYNNSWNNERAVEVPLVMKYIKQFKGQRILEVGNVLYHYFDISHDVVDKYEQSPNAINSDIVDYQPDQPYNLIVTISTLEHVGWDEAEKDADKINHAIDNLKNCLADRGLLVVTLPLGYNPELDRYIEEGKLHLDDLRFLKRVSKDNRWIEVDYKDVKDVKYNEPYPLANGLVLSIYQADNTV